MPPPEQGELGPGALFGARNLDFGRFVIRQFGGPEKVEYADAPEPEVGAGEAPVRLAAASINPIDIIERAGLTKDFTLAAPNRHEI